MKPEFDEVSQEHTTGHEWNGIKELNTPVPKVFRLWLWGSIVVGIVLSVLYPGWPYIQGIGDYTKGILGHSSRVEVDAAVAEGAEQRQAAFAPFMAQDIETLAQNMELRDQILPATTVLYEDNCAACHGPNLAGQLNFPNLTDSHWLWSGTPDEIEYTLQVGINSGHEDTRFAQMPAFGRDELLEPEAISDVADYVLSLSGQAHTPEAATRGAVIFEENCVSCHGDAGAGGVEIGAPSLADSAWIYGGARAEILKTLEYGRQGHMPHWQGRLADEDIRKLALFVYWAAQGHGSN